MSVFICSWPPCIFMTWIMLCMLIRLADPEQSFKAAFWKKSIICCYGLRSINRLRRSPDKITAMERAVSSFTNRWTNHRHWWAASNLPPIDALCLILMNWFALVSPSILPVHLPLTCTHAVWQTRAELLWKKKNQSTHPSVSSPPGALQAKAEILTKCLLAILLSCPGLHLAK